MSDYTQVTFFAPKDALPSGNPSKLIKGTEIDPEFSAISTAIASKYDSADVADNTQAAAATSDAVLMTPAKVKHLLENATFDLATGVTKDGLALVLSSRTLTAGAGLTGGGDLSTDRSFAVGAGTGITVNADDVALDTTNTRNVDHAAVSVSAGGALTGGGTLAANRTITLDVNGLTEETSVQGALDFVLLYDASSGTHKKAKPDNISAAFGGFVPNARQVISGNGLTGGGDLSADRTLNVGAGTGIAVAADSVSLSHLGLESLVDPNADRIAFWDDSAGAFQWLSLGSGLAITGTTLDTVAVSGYASNSSVASQDATSTTTLAAYSAVSHGSVPAGTYRVNARGTGTCSGGNHGVRLGIGGTNVTSDGNAISGWVDTDLAYAGSAAFGVGAANGVSARYEGDGTLAGFEFALEGVITLTGTGTIELLFAQSTSNATATTILSGRLSYERIA